MPRLARGSLAPSEASTLAIILYGLLGLLGIGVSLFVAPLIGALAAIPFWKTNRKQETYQRQEFYNRACGMLREYYEFREPFLVTKCYASSDRKFDRHDVCLFIVDDELRITANLHYGFFDPKRDLGCYALTRQEIRLQDTEHKDRPAVQLQAEDLSFTLARRAKAFIENDFLGRTP